MKFIKYVKKPVVVEAVQWTGENIEEIQRFGGGNVRFVGTALRVDSLEGNSLRAEPGDWIIKGVKGEFYPCKHDIFEATYDKVKE